MATKKEPAKKGTATKTAVKKAAAAAKAAPQPVATLETVTAGSAAGTRVLAARNLEQLELRKVSSLEEVALRAEKAMEAEGSNKAPEIPCHFMDGEFRGDFTRDTFDPCKAYVRVLMQQGRVQLDADWNEQASILLRYMQTLAADIIGPFGGPRNACGFQITADSNQPKNFWISRGRYYINGVLCENNSPILYTQQVTDSALLPDIADSKTYVVYLDAWERSVSWIEDPEMLEVALNGPDTAARAKIEWMVRASDSLYYRIDEHFVTDDNPVNCQLLRSIFSGFPMVLPAVHGRLAPIRDTDDQSRDICTIHPDSRYRGTENQLYRVEIHTGGTAGNATFKWSRENGSVQFPVVGFKEDTLILGNLGKDDARSLKPGNLVEIVDDDLVKMNSDLAHYIIAAFAKEPENVTIPNSGTLFRVKDIDPVHQTVTLDGNVNWSFHKENHPLLRRWDQPNPDAEDNCMTILESDESGGNPITLEDGISVRFSASCYQERARNQEKKAEEQINTIYIPGSYWLIPARVISGGPDWPKNGQEYKILPPHGTMHYYAPLCILTVEKGGKIGIPDRCWCKFPLTSTSFTNCTEEK